MTDDENDGDDSLVAPGSDVATSPGESADPAAIVAQKIFVDIFHKYEVFSFRNAAVILSETRRDEFDEILEALRGFSITSKLIGTAGGNELEIPKLLSASLRPKGWHETMVQGDLLVRLSWRE